MVVVVLLLDNTTLSASDDDDDTNESFVSLEFRLLEKQRGGRNAVVAHDWSGRKEEVLRNGSAVNAVQQRVAARLTKANIQLRFVGNTAGRCRVLWVMTTRRSAAAAGRTSCCGEE